ncbi:molecular chaperone TorD family protein [Shewanella alkalitolerans]|uniref:TorD/DmsD family molecular chaperone n=1 Tax=Shewanella alkalitolerans TaxID=2864209 RepID=UPI001C65C714|nr:molecular chaperone TorD family protein [Shewanella alkalitolerans]QYJ97911.1 molecular chaperone TorD family protein [Shewanella alkalitolerans]
MTEKYGPTAMAYHAFKSMMFAPSDTQAVAGLIAYLEQETPDSPLLIEARKFSDDASELEFDFNRMCIGPYKLLVAPYESVYLSGNRQLFTEETLRVAEFYQQIGLVIDDSFNEPADFIGNELEFLYCLHAMASEQQALGQTSYAEELLSLADEFIQAHLGRWIVPFCEGITQHAKQAFWRLFAETLVQFINQQAHTTQTQYQQV